MTKRRGGSFSVRIALKLPSCVELFERAALKMPFDAMLPFEGPIHFTWGRRSWAE